jgi:two-component SAPR family response regulator
MKVIIIEDETQSAQLLINMLSEIDNSIEVIEVCKKLPEAIISIKKNRI